MTLKIAIAAGLMLSPALALAQPPEQLGNGMGTEADAAAHSNTTPTPGTKTPPPHRSTKSRSTHARTTHGSPKDHTTTNGSAPLNAMPH